MMGNFYNMGWGFGFGGILTIIFWVFIIWAIIALIKYSPRDEYCGSCKNGKEEKSSKSLDILKERYAKGEIDKEAFNQMKKDLE